MECTQEYVFRWIFYKIVIFFFCPEYKRQTEEFLQVCEVAVILFLANKDKAL